ncbi:hypothetical protein RDI58_014707 [Solanum bulbocastanum]|uniref:Uncharacterized protein n=1 Tax=Solanum bulbocastanum TaxID=147425 RepID=A0AAN8TJ44_SOLBU
MNLFLVNSITCIDSKKGKYRVLSSDRVVGDPGQWNVVKDSRPVVVSVPLVIKNNFDALIHNEEERISEETLQVANPANDNITFQNKEKVIERPTSSKEWLFNSCGLSNGTSSATVPIVPVIY